MAAQGSLNTELMEQFIAVTGADRNVAISFLEACAGDLDMAVGMHMDSGGGASSSGIRQEGCSSMISNDSEGDVRAPIPQRTEVLVEDDTSRLGSWRIRRHRQRRSVFDGLRNFQDEESLHDEFLKGKRPSKKRSLEELYRPPVDITFKGTFHAARDAGSAQNKWLLVNVQNVQEFSCQLLNRDVWSSAESRGAIKDNFIFWQVYNDSDEGNWFIQFYQVNKWPYVAIIDPFTGEKQVVWDKISDGHVFCELVKEFVSMCPVPDNSLMSPAVKRQRTESSILDASEQEQMEAAIQASLVESKTKINSPQYVFDSDSEADACASSDIETFSDSCDVIFSSPPGSSNGVSGAKVSLVTTLPSPQPLNEHNHQSHNQPPSSTPPSTSNSSSVGTNNNIRRLTSRNFETQVLRRIDPGPSEEQWSMTPPSQTGHDGSPEVNIESSLIDMIGCREAEVGTPDTYTLGDDSPSDSQLSVPDRELQSSSNQSPQSGNSWTDYWGHPSDPAIRIMIRFPNNTREQVQLPCTSQLKALTVFCSSQGFPADKYELVTNYPHRKLSKMISSLSLKEAGLHVQETVFVQDL